MPATTALTPVDLDELDLRALDRQALARAAGAVAQVRPDHMDLPTPCVRWTVRDLLLHMVNENHGFAANAVAGAPDPTAWSGAGLDPDPRTAFDASVARVTAAFAAPDMLTRHVGVREYGVFTGQVALSMHVVDNLVHAWDLATAIGADNSLDEELSTTALRIALRWPYQRPDGTFDVRVEVPGDAPAGQRLVAYLGRSPSWSGGPTTPA